MTATITKEHSAMPFSVFSLNLWNLNQDYCERMRRLDQYVSKADPEIICLQEVSPQGESFRPQSDLVSTQNTQLMRLYSSQNQWGEREEGLATMASLPLISFESFMLPEATGDGSRRLQIATFNYSGQRILVANTHLAFRLEQDAERVSQCKTIVRHLENAARHHGTDAVVLVGDFNATPQSAPVKTIMESQLGLFDLFEGTEARANSFTYCSHSPHSDDNPGPSRWIDYMFATSRLAVSSAALALDGGKSGNHVSDHVALFATFELVP
ncbi:MAG: endonuclease/exonuclease/phosphatase family protein [Alphaproteobacteria bacterium]|nr:endonuclease/exonuclease/phosphatase family protein [Alphaproteobacteria bacterium]